jgi:hypothetical protein
VKKEGTLIKGSLAFSILLLAIFITTTLTSVSSAAQSNSNKVASNEQMKGFYENNNETFVSEIPPDILTKYKDTIDEIDKILKTKYKDEAITSHDDNFNLNYYGKLIQLGIRTDLDNEDPLIKKIDEFTNEIAKLTIKGTKVDELDRPTLRSTKKEKDKVKTSLDASSYDVDGAIAYAHLWCEEGKTLRNPDYDFYDGMNDCTNFVSQVLYEGGGIPQVEIDVLGINYQAEENWYYNNGTGLYQPSYTWGGAHNLYYHLKNQSNSVRRVYSTADLEEGDIVQWDIYPDDGEFHIGHSTVVTKIESDGDILLTYHTTDREDYNIDNLFNAGYVCYAWAVNH